MQIQLVSHASVIVTCGQTGIWTDPWLVGKAFNNSWTLLPDPAGIPIPYDQIQYIWISHEHPDHFNVPTLKSLPEDFKKSVTVLFQKTNSDKIFNALRDFGFQNFLPMENKKLLEIEPGLEVYCYQNHFIDSCLGVKHQGQVVFNVNDAELEREDCQRILADLGHVDVCLNQFSLAGYRGFADRERYLPKMASEKLERMLVAHQQLDAGYTLPFASFIYFSTADNRYMNAYANRPADVYRRFQQEGLDCALLYPGDRWDIARPFDSTENVRKFEHLFDSLDNLPYEAPPVVPLEEMAAAFAKMTENLRDRYPAFLLNRIPPLTAFVPDLGHGICFDLRYGTCEPVGLSEERCDLTVYSQPLHFGFKFPFGVETLAVSARVTVRHNYKNWQRFKRLCVLYSAEIYLHPRYLMQPRNYSYLWSRLTSSLVGQALSRAQRQQTLQAASATT